MLDIIPKANIGAKEIKLFRSISSLGISEIKQAASHGQSIRNFEAFANDWEQQRLDLVEIYKLYEQGNASFNVVDNEYNQAEILGPKQFLSKLKQWRELELETQMNSDLENGFISDESEFEAHDDDWI